MNVKTYANVTITVQKCPFVSSVLVTLALISSLIELRNRGVPDYLFSGKLARNHRCDLAPSSSLTALIQTA